MPSNMSSNMPDLSLVTKTPGQLVFFKRPLGERYYIPEALRKAKVIDVEHSLRDFNNVMHEELLVSQIINDKGYISLQC